MARGSKNDPHTAQPTAPTRMIVGVDFGTTCTGISYGLTNKPDEVYSITDWPGMSSRSFEKVPTEIAYGTEPGAPESFSWGFKAQKDPNRLRWFKLLLNQGNLSGDVKYITANYTAAMPRNKQAVDVVRDFLSGLMGHLETEIGKRYGPHYFKTVLKRYVFTVPAMWSDRAKTLTQKAAKEAGFLQPRDEIWLVPEPEAAALCCLKSIQQCKVNVGNNIIVADCGGGTVDVISYKILKLEPLLVAEAAVGEGDLCGSVYVNFSFEDFIKGRLSPAIFNSLSDKKKQTLDKGFEQDVKRNFSNDPGEGSFSFGVPGLADTPDGTIEDGYLELTRSEIVAIFMPVLERIEKLINSQRDQIEKAGGTVAALLLVGGFGNSAYLLRHFREWGSKNNDIVVLQPPDGWGAICRGAVMHGIENVSMVKSRVARRFYGVPMEEVFDEDEHEERYRFWDKKYSRWYCKNRVQWIIKKGDKVSNSEPIDQPFVRSMWKSEFGNTDARIFHDRLLAYDGNIPPKYTDVPGVHVIGNLRSDLRRAPDTHWAVKNHGTEEDVMEINFDLRMTLRNALLDFELWIKDKSYGGTQVVFDEGV